MPMYDYRCDACDHTTTEFGRMEDSAATVTCSECGQRMHRDFQSEAAGPHTLKEFYKPIEMHSIALTHPEDMVAFKQRNPDTDISMDPEDPLFGVPVVYNRKEKLDVLRKEGFEEKN